MATKVKPETPSLDNETIVTRLQGLFLKWAPLLDRHLKQMIDPLQRVEVRQHQRGCYEELSMATSHLSSSLLEDDLTAEDKVLDLDVEIEDMQWHLDAIERHCYRDVNNARGHRETISLILSDLREAFPELGKMAVETSESQE